MAPVQTLTKTPRTIIDLTSPRKSRASGTPRPESEQDLEEGNGEENGKANRADLGESLSESEDDTDSFYEEIIETAEEFDDDERQQDPEVCTLEESLELKQRVHDIGTEAFVFETVTSGKYTARKLLTAFNVRAPLYFADAPDSAYLPLLGTAIARELSKRRKLPDYNTFEDAVTLLKRSNHCMVVTGAGISTSVGIPDFRSKASGFYSQLREMNIQEPEEVFTLCTFDEDPTLFYSLAGAILPTHKKWSPTHEFIRLLQEKDKLLTNYTQNIDNLESEAGVSKEKLVQCHGSFATASCRKCGYQVPGTDIFQDILGKRVALCKKCSWDLGTGRTGLKRKRSSVNLFGARKRRIDDDCDDDGRYDIPQPGVMKPDIVFFGEPLPKTFFDRLVDHDRGLVDLVIIIGTSMQVAPVSELPQFLPANVPNIYISRERATHINFDIELLGDCDTVITELCRRVGWNLDHPMVKPNCKITVNTLESYKSVHTVQYLEGKE